MLRDMDSVWAKDQRGLEELVATALLDPDSDRSQQALATIRFRGSQAEFDAAARLTASEVPAERSLGAAILGQLGWDEHTFLEPSVDLLMPMLRDSSTDVIESAIYALGHRDHARAAAPIAAFRSHPDDDIRVAVAFSLASLIGEAPEEAAALVELTRDRCADVRDWATFGFRLQAEERTVDSPEIREALVERVGDQEAEVRGEALLALASLADPRALPLLRAELANPLENSLVIEAAEIIGDPSLAEPLHRAWTRLDDEGRHWFDGQGFFSTFAACGGDPDELSLR